MSSRGKAEIRQICATSCRTDPPYHKTAAEMLDRCRSFYADPENEKAFQAWMAERRGNHGEKAV